MNVILGFVFKAVYIDVKTAEFIVKNASKHLSQSVADNFEHAQRYLESYSKN